MTERLDIDNIKYHLKDIKVRNYKRNTIYAKLSTFKKDSNFKEYLSLKVAYELHKIDKILNGGPNES